MKNNSFLLIFFLILLLMPQLIRAEITATISSDKAQALVSEKVTVTLTINGEINSIKKLKVVDGFYKNAIVSKPASFEDNAVRSSFGGVITPPTYIYTFYPQEAGTLHIPPFKISYREVQVTSDKYAEINLTTNPLDIDVTLPPGAPADAFVLVTPNLSVKTEYKPESTQIKVGDAFTRTITIRADNVPDVLIGKVTTRIPEELKAYPSQPTLSQDYSATTAGDIVSTRVQEATFVATHAGTATIPAADIYWYDGKKLHTATIASRSWQIIDSAGTVKNPMSRKMLYTVILLIVFTALCGWLLYRFRAMIMLFLNSCKKRLYGSRLYRRYNLIEKLNP